jgi:hypothetical protein
MSIFVMASGRLKETPRFTDGKTSVTLIANDASNRAQRIVIASTDAAIGNVLRRLKAGDMVTASGEAAFDRPSMLYLTARRIQVLDATEPVSLA